MQIRLATLDDLPAIVALQHRSQEAAQWIQDDYERLIEDPGGKVLMAELLTTDPPKILGFAAFHRIIDEVEIRNIAVDPEHRQQGVGKALLEAARDRMLQAGVKRVFLEVRGSNKPALSLYYAIGFGLHSRRPDYYRDPQEDALVLSLELLPPTVVPGF